MRIVNDFFGRLDGPLHFRIILQPTMAVVLAIRDGLKDARGNQPAYFWSLFTESTLRRELLRSGWASISRIFFLALCLDIIYQLIVFHWFYPLQSLFVAVLLALIPYLLIRGPVNRIKQRLGPPHGPSQQTVATAPTVNATTNNRTAQ